MLGRTIHQTTYLKASRRFYSRAIRFSRVETDPYPISQGSNIMSVTFISSVSHKFFTAIVVVALALGSLQVTPAYAATITVTTTADEYDVAPGNGFCSLREAIANANSDALTRVDCPAGTGADTITLTSGFTYALTLVGTTATTGDLDISDVDGLII